MVRAVIFDMDGVLVDTEFTYQQLELAFFRAHGVNLSVEEAAAVAGGSSQEYERAVERWWRRASLIAPEERGRSPIDLVDTMFQQDMPPLESLAMPGLSETLATLASAGIRLAVASSSRRDEIETTLTACGVRKRFEAVVGGDEVPATKPNPAVYLRALELLGLDAEQCVAVEDSDKGIAAARAAGLRVVVRRETRIPFEQRGGTWYVNRLMDVAAIVADA